MGGSCDLMLFFAHLGITLAAAEILAVACDRNRQAAQAPEVDPPDIADPPWEQAVEYVGRVPRFSAFVGAETAALALAKRVDCRVLLLGAILPDLIDKPLGVLILGSVFSYGRIFAHTVLFAAALFALGGFLFLARGKTWGLALAAGSATHLVLDQMWLTPSVLFWPLLGWSFPRHDTSLWLLQVFRNLVANPSTYVTETIGIFILLQFLVVLARRRQLEAWIRKGRVD